MYVDVRGRKVRCRVEKCNNSLRDNLKGDCYVPVGRFMDYDGYFSICFNYVSYRLHRLIIADYLGVPYDSFDVARHLCDNRSCVNVEHLAIGTVKDNTDDTMYSNNKGRPGIKYVSDQLAAEIYTSNLTSTEAYSKYGISVGVYNNIKRRSTHKKATEGLIKGSSNKITDDNVKYIFLSTEPYSVLATMLGITVSMIVQIKTRRSYKHVTKDLERGESVSSKINKLTNQDVVDIYTSSLSIEELASMYNVNYSTISSIKKGITYSHLTADLKIGIPDRRAQKRLSESEINKILNSDLPPEKIACELDISVSTVHYHRSRNRTK